MFAACAAKKHEIVSKSWKLDLKGVDEPRSTSEKVNAGFAQLKKCLFQYSVPDVETHKPASKVRINSLAVTLASLCGFNDGSKFCITTEKISFKLGGNGINSVAEVYVAGRADAEGQVVLIWEDKLSKRQKTLIGGNADMLQDSAAQIIGEMLSVHYRNNLRQYKPAEVYAIRLIADIVAFFRMEMSEEEIKAVCTDGVIPNPKLQV